MDFKNVAHLCKGLFNGFEKYDPSTFWKGMSVCIANDGWVIRTSKREVATWCLARIDEDINWFKQAYPKFGFGLFMDEIEKYHKYDSSLSTDDCIIMIFRNIIRYADMNLFDKKFKPNFAIIGPQMEEAYIDNDGFHFAELRSEAENRINLHFSKFEEQKDKVYWNIDYFLKECEKYNRN